jgi:hypothetical protein
MPAKAGCALADSAVFAPAVLTVAVDMLARTMYVEHHFAITSFI